MLEEGKPIVCQYFSLLRDIFSKLHDKYLSARKTFCERIAHHL